MTASPGPATASGRRRLGTLLALVALLYLPIMVEVWGRAGFLGSGAVDQRGHVWAMWSVSQGEWPWTHLVAAPTGLDLLPIVGGWLDLWLGALLSTFLPLSVAWNTVLALYLLLAGVGGTVLARVAGAGLPVAVVGGLVLQLDGFIWQHLLEGRPEQAGLGALALAIAAATHCWRTPGWRAALGAGAAGALVVYLSWELTLFLGLTYLWLGLSLLLTSPAPREGLRRSAGAALAFLVLAGPWMWLFVQRTRTGREHAGDFGKQLSEAVSMGVFDWWLPGRARAPVICLVLLLVLPFLERGVRRRLVAAVGVGLALCLVLALGPAPRLWGPPVANPTTWGPFALLQALPVLEWFHWPDRLMVGFSLAGAPAAALVVQAAARRGRALGLAVAVLILGLAGLEFVGTRPAPTAEMTTVSLPALTQLRDLPEEGGLVDLPLPQRGVPSYSYELLQLQHGRPLLHHSFEEDLVLVDPYPQLERWRRWASQLGQPIPGGSKDQAVDWAPLRSQGFAFVALHQGDLPRQRWVRMKEDLDAELGEPVLREGDRWICWRLPGTVPAGGG